MNSTATMSSTLPQPKSSSPRDPTRFFYTGAALLMLVLAVWGFEQFYLHGKSFPGRPLTPPIRSAVIEHGIAMSAWIILLVIQPLLIANGKYRVHMALGKIGAVLAVCVVFLGYRVAVGAAGVNPPELKLWGLVPKQFLAIPLIALVLFAGYVAVGVWKRNRPEIHKPMMFFATLAAIAAAVDRIPFITQFYTGTALGEMFGPYLPPTVIGLTLLLLKWALTKSFDRAFAAAFVVLAVTGPIVMKLATTQAWESFAGFLVR